MANWCVTREKIQILPHPNPAVERLELGKVGQYQVVVGKGIFQDGTVVIFVPEKSILPDSIADDGDRRKYLVGENKNRVKAIQMQKELSQGIILDDKPELSDIPLGEDISTRLGIIKYIPPIPDELSGEVINLEDIGDEIHQHDVELFNLHATEFVAGEPVVVTEKIHGTQGVYLRTKDGKRFVSSKGLIKNSQFFSDAANNAYKRAASTIQLFEKLDAYYPGKNVQAFGEVIPFQKGFGYGQLATNVLLFRIDVDGKTIPLAEVPSGLRSHWVPVVYEGALDMDVIRPMREGKETLSGKMLHIREGIVVTPAIPRRASGNFALFLKLLNPKYAPDLEEVG
jgi:RNA ligase (TIGR02306 family)